MPRSFSTMLERWITALHTEDAGLEAPAATRDRLKDRFPKNATRRMSQLGLLVGTALEPLQPGYDDALIYASAYAETRALEGYLDSFPTPSPTLFQTSIHPSAVQQSLITSQRPIRQFLPLTGGVHLPAQALLTAFLAGSPRVILCGGEERGTWLLDHGRSSDRTFAFALTLASEPVAGSLARVTLDFSDESPHASCDFPLPVFFDHLHNRRPVDACVLPGRRLRIEWTP
ncbi:MAG: hypothetical protein ACAH89_00625 [Rariglobus sp.]